MGIGNLASLKPALCANSTPIISEDFKGFVFLKVRLVPNRLIS